MAAARTGGWLQGKTVRRSGLASSSTSATRSSTPQIQSTSATIFGGGVKDPSGRTSEYFVCRDFIFALYSALTPVCESCIDRLFTLGPAPCPICNKTLRKLAFTPQTFEDLTVEKEVAVRRRIAKDFNKRREDFPNLRAYNDHLEQVEELTFNLINDIDVPETEARIQKYKAENAALIELNLQREEAYARALKEQEEGERREREARALELRQEEEAEREEKEKDRRSIIDKLETSDKDATKVIARAKAHALKRTNARNVSTSAMQSSAQLLRSRAAQSFDIPDVPHVPLQDDYYAYEDMFELKPEMYDDVFSEAVRKDREGIMRAGGYILEEAWERAIRCAVAGLDLAPLVGLVDVPIPRLPGLDDSGDVVMA
ncbi:hypothetical protein D9611_004482 [Ephemerocybe angulata]|uniref:RNA polymerase II transcription factor B subunit 3 n=1 Tax=Ephemerocybe angulata TaxID=980116 RepID=A0A8H5BJX5_9AGAR|nr:hypothetical protein D9611_004482 [Tulosesus angulatus]